MDKYAKPYRTDNGKSSSTRAGRHSRIGSLPADFHPNLDYDQRLMLWTRKRLKEMGLSCLTPGSQSPL